MWNGNDRTPRIALEAKGKAMEQKCSLQSETEMEEETKRDEMKKYMLYNLKLWSKQARQQIRQDLQAQV